MIKFEANTESEHFVLEFPNCGDEMHISEFHRLCKQFAATFGYATESIEKYFGDSCWDEE